MKKRKVDPWFPFWIDKWLFGSTRIELEPDERGVFVDLISLSKKDSGFIRANEGVPYLENQLCGLLNISSELFKRTVKKCIKYGKTEKLKDGTLYMTSYEIYSLSERQERRIESEMAESADDMAEKPDTKNRIDKNKQDKKENKKEKIAIPNWIPKKEFDEYKKMRTKIRKPMTDRAVELAIKKLETLKSEGYDPQQVLEQSILNSWQGLFPLKDDRKEFKPSQVGQSTKKTTPERDEYYKTRQKKGAEIRAKYKKDISDIRKAGDKEAWDILQEKIADELREWSINHRESMGG